MALKADFVKKLESFSLKIGLEIQDECIGLLGESGCGKSMALKCIAGIETPDKGMVEMDGKVLFDSKRRINLPPRKRKIGYLFQNYALFPNMTVEKNIKSGMEGRRGDPGPYVKKFRLEGLEGRMPATLSGGQKQRTALARMLAARPRMILLDEPFSALDSSLRWEMEQEVAALLEEFSGTAMVVSHNREEMFRLCSRIALMERGMIQDTAEKHALFDNPGTGYGAALTGCKNISPAQRVDDTHVFARDWQLTLTVPGPVPEKTAFAAIRAHHLEFSQEKGENAFPCRVIRRIESVFEDIYLVDCGGKPLRLEARKGTLKSLLFLRIPKDKVMLLR